MLAYIQFLFFQAFSKTILEYKFYKNFGKTFHDYSGQNQIGFNGNSPEIDSQDTLATTKGAYFQSNQGLITIPYLNIENTRPSATSNFTLTTWIKILQDYQNPEKMLIVSGNGFEKFSFTIDSEFQLGIEVLGIDGDEKLVERFGKIKNMQWTALSFHMKDNEIRIYENLFIVGNLVLDRSIGFGCSLSYFIGGSPFGTQSMQGFIWSIKIYDVFISPLGC